MSFLAVRYKFFNCILLLFIFLCHLTGDGFRRPGHPRGYVNDREASVVLESVSFHKSDVKQNNANHEEILLLVILTSIRLKRFRRRPALLQKYTPGLHCGR